MVKPHVWALGIPAGGMPVPCLFSSHVLTPLSRTSSHKPETTVGQCLSPLLRGVTRQPFRLRQVIKSIIPSMFRSEISRILLGEHTETVYFQLPAYPYQKVSHI